MFDSLWEIFAWKSAAKGATALADLCKLQAMERKMLEEEMAAMEEDDAEDDEEEEEIIKSGFAPGTDWERKEYDPDNPDEVPFHWE